MEVMNKPIDTIRLSTIKVVICQRKRRHKCLIQAEPRAS